MAPVKILIVDDYDFWRYCMVSMLKEHTEFEIAGEGEDGIDAVEMSTELQPDIVLLDLSLPDMNGFEAAAEIRKVSPASRIVFVTQSRTDELVERARRVGALGYVLKTEATRELLPALQGALSGKWTGR